MKTYQSRVLSWMIHCFGPTITYDIDERNYRFLEEATELVQACGCSKEDAHRIIEQVYAKPPGEPIQEVGGVMVTLASHCIATGISFVEAAEMELRRIWTKVPQIRQKQLTKTVRSV